VPIDNIYKRSIMEVELERVFDKMGLKSNKLSQKIEKTKKEVGK
jgi:hypothetical protein